jgi:hypothetical protein
MEDRQYREAGQGTTIHHITCRARGRRRDEVQSGIYVGVHNLVFSLLFRLQEWGTGTFRHNYPIQLPTAVAVKLVF